MLYVSRKEHFNAAHKLWNQSWSKEKNLKVFGPCANENWHGHNFELIVTVKGTPDMDTGFVVDMKKLSDVIQARIIEQVDHKNLNIDVPFMEGKIASCENLIIAFWDILYSEVRKLSEGATLHQLRLFETPRNFVDYFGES